MDLQEKTLHQSAGEPERISLQHLQDWMIAELSERLGLPAHEIDIHEPFVNFGLDSAEAVILSGDLVDLIGVPLSPTVVWEYPSIAELTQHLMSQLEEVAAAPLADEPLEKGLPTDVFVEQPDRVPHNEPIAIIGIGCRFPGADGPEAFWELLKNGVDAITEVPPGRWEVDAFYDADPSVPGKMNTRWGGFVENVDGFDNRFFGIAPHEAARMDPQQRLLLEVAWEALADGGLPPSELAGSKTGVFVGISTHDYSRLQFHDPELIDAYAGTGNAFSIAANRLSYLLDLRGPSLSVDTACSSSLVTVHLACQSLRSGECSVALAGGVNLILRPDVAINFAKAGAMAPDGRCKTFDARANGYVRGEGAGLLVLKPLSAALADGDEVYAVIRGSAVNQDGRSNGLMAPNGLAQEAVLREAYLNAGISPGQVHYIEAHGTGTELGDPIEVQALGRVLQSDRWSERPCTIGSVKSNIGHLEAAAGVAGLIKVALSLKHSLIPPSLHYESPNPHIPFHTLPLHVQQTLTPWDLEPEEQALAGVSSFGFGGTNAHVVLEQFAVPSEQADAVADEIEQDEPGDRAELLVLSAHTPEALQAMAERMLDFAQKRMVLSVDCDSHPVCESNCDSDSDDDYAVEDPMVSLRDLCYTAGARRDHLDERLALVVRTPDELAERLHAFLAQEARPGVHVGEVPPGRTRGPVFVFPGQGGQWLGMGRQLYETEPVFRSTLERCDELVKKYAGWQLLPELFATPEDSHLQQTEYTQPLLFAIQVALTELWRSWGVQPVAVIGHSMGEVAAAHVAGVLTLEQAVEVICRRGRVMRPASGLGKMANIEISPEDAEDLLQSYDGRVSIAAVNAHDSIVVAGDGQSVEQITETMQQRGVFARLLQVDLASHSPQMEPLRPLLESGLAAVKPLPAFLPIYSTVTGRLQKGPEFDAAYWGRNLRETVRFAEALDHLLADGYRSFLEISPHNVLTYTIQEALRRREWNGCALPSLRRDEDERSNLFSTLGALYTLGCPLYWLSLYPAGRHVTLPAYPWQRERFWLDEAEERLRTVPGVNRALLDEPARWEAIVQRAGEQAALAPLDLGLDTYADKIAWLDEFTNDSVITTLVRLGIFTTEGDRHTVDELIAAHGLLPTHRKLLLRWFQRLIALGLLEQDGDEYRNREPLTLPPEDTESRRPEQDLFIEYLRRSGEHLPEVLRGNVSPLELFFPNGSFDTTEQIYQHSPEARYFNAIAAAVAKGVAETTAPGQPLRLLEVGAGTGSTSASILPVLPKERAHYVFTDLSELFLARARHKFTAYPFLDYRLLNIEDDPEAQGLEAQSFDLIIGANVLHATRDLHETLEHVRRLLAPGGLLLLWEVTDHQTWFDITFGTIDGWQRHEDDVRGDNPLLTTDTWRSVLEASGFVCIESFPQPGSPAEIMRQHILIAQVPGSVHAATSHQRTSENGTSATRSAADAQKSPVLENEALRLHLTQADEAERRELVTRFLQHRSNRLLGHAPSSLDLEQPLTTLGLDSLMAVELRNEITRSTGVTVPVAVFLQGAGIAGLTDEVLARLREASASAHAATTTATDGATDGLAAEASIEAAAALAEPAFVRIEPDPERRSLPFPLNDIQQAYWIGRSGALELGNVSTQLYLEFEGPELDLPRLSTAWQRLIERHEMLRAIVHPNGEQQILQRVPPYIIAGADLRGYSAEEIDGRLAAVREEMSQTVRHADQWPLFDIRTHQLDGGRTRVHIALDFLIADAASLLILFREWAHFYKNPGLHTDPLLLSFRDYVLAEQAARDTEPYRRSLSYWQKRLPDLPAAPELPLAKNPGALDRPRFRRRTAEFGADRWSRLKQRAAAAGLTPSMVLCAAYAEVLGRWSKHQAFTLNLTLFNRQPLHPEVGRIVGDFTSLNLLAVDNREPTSFAERARRLQNRFLEDFEHNRVSGVHVLREWARLQGKSLGAPMPVVFTSVLEDFHEQMNWLGEMVYSISQTPQVWLDHQVLERDGKLHVIWDAVEELFPAGLLDDMFEAYCRLLRLLSSESARAEAAWQEAQPLSRLPKLLADHQEISKANATDLPLPQGLLHTAFAVHARIRPEQRAVVAQDRTLTYDELHRHANQLARRLRELGARPNTLVAVLMEKGWEQVVAVLGILHSGAAYLPLDPKQPPERLHHLLEQGEATLCLTQRHLQEKMEWPAGVTPLCVDDEHVLLLDDAPLEAAQQPDDLAYVIFTSGSTGLPKGVMIDHRGALNTIADINARYEVGPNDRVFALSALNFDLSVYDIFGTLAAGGTIIMPEPDAVRDPARWRTWIKAEQISIWNSVPALMNLLVEAAEGEAQPLSYPTLRLALLSGDWIPLNLPDRIRQLAPTAEIVSLGGATEVSIWSVAYPVGIVDPCWKSIPYGRPLGNQRCYVLNDLLEPCPVWVPGQLFIGGIGLAHGYWRDPERTADSFLTHPVTGERLYRTGDLGRWLPDGQLEFLGREDFQVKVQGYRIELGEIEHALLQRPEIRQAVVQTVGEAHGEKRLVAYLVACEDAELSADHLREELKRHLPEYMVPQRYAYLRELPLSANGKVDRQALPALAPVPLEDEAAHVPPSTPLQATLAAVWSELLGVERIGIHDNFFALGGHSVHTIQAVVRLQRAGYHVNAQQMFEHQTVAALAEAIEAASPGRQLAATVKEKDRRRKTQQALVPAPSAEKMAFFDDGSRPPASLDTVNANANANADGDTCTLSTSSANECPTAAAAIGTRHVFLTGATGYVGIYLLREWLVQTSANVHCLLRGESEEEALHRLEEQWNWYFPGAPWIDAQKQRIHPVVGDIGLEQFGLGNTAYGRLANTVDLICHAAAKVSHFGDPTAFQGVNVDGTRHVLQFAATGRPKRLQHLSTIGVRGIDTDISTFYETDFDLGQHFDTRYAESKWLAEKVVREAMADGLQANIYRLGFVAADSHSGTYQRNIGENALYRYLRATLHMGVAPYLPDLTLDFIPVDFIAEAIVTLSQVPHLNNETFHLIHPQGLRHYDLLRTFQALGFSIALLDPDEFQTTVFSFSENPDFQTELEGIVGFEDASRAQIFRVDDTRTLRHLQEAGLASPKLSPEWVRQMVKHAIDVGYFKAPPHFAKIRSLPSLLGTPVS